MITLSQEQRQVLENKFKEFQNWKENVGKEEIRRHKEKSNIFRQKLSKENIVNISEEDFKKCWGDSFAGGFISTVGQDKWWKKHIIEKNKGFENVKQYTIELLYGSDELPQRFEDGIKNIKGFADSTVSEFLNNIYPDVCPIWNQKVRTVFDNLGIKNILPKSLKGKISKASEYQECLDFFTDFKNEFSQYSINDFYDLDHFFWKYSSKKFKTSKPMAQEFSFVKKDFESTTGKKADAQYLHSRFKELLDVLDDRFDSSYARKPMSYPYRPFNRGTQKWLDHAWIGVPLASTEKNPRQATQFQVALTESYELFFMINLDDKARDTKKKVAKNIQKNIQEFLNFLRNLPENYFIEILASENSDWKEFDPKKITEQDIEYIIESLPLRNSEFAITKYVKQTEAIRQKTKIIDDILESSRVLLPIIQFLEGKKYTESSMPGQKYETLERILEYKKQVIFYGPPGTGKTREAILFAKKFASDENKIKNVTFHQSYSYDEFVEGITADVKDGKLVYDIVPGIFKKICEQARKEDNKNFVLIIDEINRGNISKIFGELISLIENNKRDRDDFAVSLAYSKKEFTVPKNVFLIGTMNTADRSLVQIDLALRRRFGFVEFMPRIDVLSDAEGISLPLLLTQLNRKILDNGGDREHQIGHSYFMKDESSLSTLDELKFAFETDVIPLLQEYFYQDYNVLKNVLGETFVDAHEKVIKQLTPVEFRKGIEEILSYGTPSD